MPGEGQLGKACNGKGKLAKLGKGKLLSLLKGKTKGQGQVCCQGQKLHA